MHRVFRVSVRTACVAAGVWAAATSAATSVAAAQEARLRAQVVSDGDPVPGAEVRAGRVVARTDSAGGAALVLTAGRHAVHVRTSRHVPLHATVDLRAGADTTVVFVLHEAVELESIVVQSTRTGRRIEDEPLRVEVLGREEIEEKMLMTPGDISMMLNETSGLRVQVTSPSLAGAGVRIQGLRGRYTLMLADGLPLHGGQTGGLGMLQVPPMDLAQVEVIKGVASAMYGSSALGGVVNLISRRPDGERELLLNRTTRGGTDGVFWAAGEVSGRTGFTLLAGAHDQRMHDVDDDGWADLPSYRRAVLRPRIFLDDGAARSLFITLGGTLEERAGGTLPRALTPAGTAFTEAVDTRRGDVGLVGRALLGGQRLLTVRASGAAQRHDHRFGDVLERDRHATLFAEVTLGGEDRGHSWVVGAAFQRDAYRARDVVGFDFTRVVPSVFAQDEVSPVEWLTLSASARVDAHDDYDAALSPRVSVLFRPRDGWSVRASAGTGHFAPTPFAEETEAIGLSRLAPPQNLALERARSGSVDVGRAVGGLELNATVFGSEIRNPVMLRQRDDGVFELFSAPQPTRTWGTDLLARLHREPLHVTATYTYTESTEHEPTGDGRRTVPLTPRHAAGIVGMWEAEDAGRIGVEFYYTGRQNVVENPWRTRTPAYVIVGVLGELRVGRARFFLNAENLLDARQTRHDPLLLPSRAPDGRWTTDAWAPLEGRTFNGGVRLEL